VHEPEAALGAVDVELGVSPKLVEPVLRVPRELVELADVVPPVVRESLDDRVVHLVSLRPFHGAILYSLQSAKSSGNRAPAAVG